MNSKDLHKHAIPIVMLAIAAVVVTFASAASLQSSRPGKDLFLAMTSQVISVDTTEKGLAKFSHSALQDKTEVEGSLSREAQVLNPLTMHFAFKVASSE